jgi:uncharacterized RDD family membrane protein YckC
VTPRAPLAVRRATPVIPRSRPRDVVNEPSLNLEMPETPQAPSAAGHRHRVEASPAVSTPPGVALPAAPGRRLIAASLDAVVLASIDLSVLYFTMRICGLTLAELSLLPRIPFAAFLLLLDGGYAVAFTATGGQTMGKMAAGIKVVPAVIAGVTTDRVPVGQAVLRALAYVVSLLPAGLGFLPALFGGDRRALHDWLAATRVVKA